MPRVIPLLVIAGPTACGKTEAAIAVARAVGGEIISADSMQIYRGMDIGTAKPDFHQRRQVRFHLVDFVPLDAPYTVADFQRDATRAICEIWGRGALPILCGGTGLYIRAVLEHYVFPGSPSSEHGVPPAWRNPLRRQLQADLERLGSQALHFRLASVDPDAAARINPADGKRIVRALEVWALTGRPVGARERVDERATVKYNGAIFILSRPRPVLYAAIEDRVEAMLRAGWLEEVAAIQAQGYSPALQSLQAIGYRHLLDWLRQSTRGGTAANLDAVIRTIKRDTRRFAKRQLTWFRREAAAQWLEWRTRADFCQAVRLLCHHAYQLCPREEAGP